jgi:hypothetical protein
MLSLVCRHGEIVAELREAGGVLLLMNSRWMLRGYGTFASAEAFRATRAEDSWSDVLISVRRLD